MSNTLLSNRNRSLSQNSIRKRLIRSSSQHQSQRQLVKNSTMTSFRPKLQRLIQQGKIQQILNSDRHSKGNLFYSGHINQIQKQLANSKKSLSSMVLKAKQKQFNINKLKNDINRLIRQKQKLNQNSERINKIYQGTLTTLQSKKQSKQVTEWTQKSYIYMKQRLLKDEYFYKVQYQQLQRQLQIQKNRHLHLQKKTHQITNQTKQIERIVNHAKHISNQQTSHKNQFIDLINQQRHQKQLLHQMKVDKIKRQSQINQLKGWVIQKQQMAKYLQILYTHRILRQIIRTKNNNLIKKYEGVHKAYLHIKSNTNIIQFDKILRKMQQQDSIYDITIKKVTDLQNQLIKMQSLIQKSKKQRDQILSSEGKNIKHDKNYYQGIEKDNYQLILSQKQKIEFRINQDQILKQRIIEWGNKMSNKLIPNKNPNQTFQTTLQLSVGMLLKK